MSVKEQQTHYRSESDSSEEEQHNAWNFLLELFTLTVCSPTLQQYLQEEG